MCTPVHMHVLFLFISKIYFFYFMGMSILLTYICSGFKFLIKIFDPLVVDFWAGREQGRDLDLLLYTWIDSLKISF